MEGRGVERAKGEMEGRDAKIEGREREREREQWERWKGEGEREGRDAKLERSPGHEERESGGDGNMSERRIGSSTSSPSVNPPRLHPFCCSTSIIFQKWERRNAHHCYLHIK